MKNTWWRHYATNDNANIRIAWYFGYAWYLPQWQATVFLPVPFNLFASRIRAAWWRLRHGWNASDSRSFNEGHAAGFKEGVGRPF